MRISFRALLSTLLLAALGACQSVPHTSNDAAYMLIGCWQGHDYQPVLGQSATWLMQRKPDGTFQIEFHSSSQPIQREAGRWKVDGEKYTTITMSIDGVPVDARDPQFTDIYLLREVTAESMTYFHARMNITFKSKKVACQNNA
jgi:hypothetical protein